jgi:hypothetical protein
VRSRLIPLGLLVGGALIDVTSGSTTITLAGITLVVLNVAFSPVGSLRRASVMPGAPP